MPVTLSLGERELVVDPHTWSLTLVDGQATMTLTYAQLLALPMTELEATLDCTTGWYSPQRWGGILLSDVLSTAYPAGRTVRAVKLMGESGYSTILIGDHVNDLLLATHLGGEPLAPRHGFPVRAVAPLPSARGGSPKPRLAVGEMAGKGGGVGLGDPGTGTRCGDGPVQPHQASRTGHQTVRRALNSL